MGVSPLPDARPRVPSSTLSGYSLIEAIGVLSIVATLAAMAATTTVATLRQKQRSTEASSLESIADALTASVRRSRTVPGTGTWAAAAASELALPAVALATNSIGNRRLLIVDPAASIGMNGGTAGLPYTQTASGATPPSNLRMVLISSVGAALPALGSVSFSSLWETAPNQLPEGWPSSWGGHPEDLSVRRLDLGALFHRVILNNLCPSNAVTWNVAGTTNRLTLAAGSRAEFWVIDTSELALYDADASLALREIVRKDLSYVVEDGQWRNRLLVGAPATASCGPFADLVESFLAAPLKPSASKANRQTVINGAFLFMHSFSFWSREGSCAHGNYWFTTQKEIADSSANIDNAAKFLE